MKTPKGKKRKVKTFYFGKVIVIANYKPYLLTLLAFFVVYLRFSLFFPSFPHSLVTIPEKERNIKS